MSVVLGGLFTSCIFTAPARPFDVSLQQGATRISNLGPGYETFIVHASQGYGPGETRVPIRLFVNSHTTPEIKAKRYTITADVRDYATALTPIEVGGPVVTVILGRTTLGKLKTRVEGYLTIESEDHEVVVRRSLWIEPD